MYKILPYEYEFIQGKCSDSGATVNIQRMLIQN